MCNNLLSPDPEIKTVGTTPAQRSLLGQYERGNLLFDVYQNLDPYEVNLRVNAFDKESFRLASSAFIGGKDLRNYLSTD